MVVKLNTVRLNGASLNHASLNGVGERLRASAGGGGGEVIPPEEPDVPVTYTLNASVENGSVKATVNGVAVTLPYVAPAGEVVKLEAVPNSGYVFRKWSDGVTSNPREVVMNSDLTYSAVCEAKTYILSASASNGVVSASVNGNAVTLPYTANEGDVVVVEVTANDGYEFEGWSDGSTDNPRSITMTADVALSATCVVKAVEKEYIQFADPAVEAVLMANNVSSDGIGITLEDAEAVTTIDNWFVDNTAITSFDEFEKFTGVTFLGSTKISIRKAFNGCTNLKSITLPQSMTTLHDGTTTYGGIGAFYGCTSLDNVGNIDVLEKIGSYAFYNCTSLYFDELNLPNLTSIGASAFYGVKVKHIVNLGSITSLPYVNHKNSLGVDVNTLESAVIPSTVTSLQDFLFYACAKLNTISVDWTKITYIGLLAFSGCASLVFEELNAPALQTLGSNAFDKAVIKRVTNLGGVTSLPNGNYSNTFGSVSGELIEVILPNTLTSLPRYFVYDLAIPSIDIPDSITQICANAFASCKSLESVICRPITPPTLDNVNAFTNTPIASGTGFIYVPDASVDTYKAATNWSQYQNRIKPLSEYNG